MGAHGTNNKQQAMCSTDRDQPGHTNRTVTECTFFEEAHIEKKQSFVNVFVGHCTRDLWWQDGDKTHIFTLVLVYLFFYY